MLNEHERAILRDIHAGEKPEASHHTASLIDKGFLTESGDSLAITDRGHDELRLLPGVGEAIVDILIPGAGSAHAEQGDEPRSDPNKAK